MSALIDIDAATVEHNRAWARDVGLLPSGVHPARKQRLAQWLRPFVVNGLDWDPYRDVCRLFEAMRQPRGGQKPATIPKIYASYASRQRYGAPAIDQDGYSRFSRVQLRNYLIELWPYMLLAYCFESDSSDPDLDPNETRPAALQRYLEALQSPQDSSVPEPKRQRPQTAQGQSSAREQRRTAEELVAWSKRLDVLSDTTTKPQAELYAVKSKIRTEKRNNTRLSRVLEIYEKSTNVEEKRKLTDEQFGVRLRLNELQATAVDAKQMLARAEQAIAEHRLLAPDLDELSAVYIPLRLRVVMLDAMRSFVKQIPPVLEDFPTALGPQRTAELTQINQIWTSRLDAIRDQTSREARLVEELSQTVKDITASSDDAFIALDRLSSRALTSRSEVANQVLDLLETIGDRSLGGILRDEGARRRGEMPGNPIDAAKLENDLQRFRAGVVQMDELLARLEVVI